MNLQAGLAKSEFLTGQITWAAASVASDVLKALTPLLIVWAIARRDVLRTIAGVVVLTVTASYSLTSALSYSHASSENATNSRTAANDVYERAKVAYREADEALKALAPSRSVDELDAKISALLVDPLAGDCHTIDGPVSRRVCPSVAELRTERAIAVERARLQGELKAAQGKLDRLPPPKVADPTTEAIAGVWARVATPPSPDTISTWLGLSGVLLIEVGSIFGLLVASGVDTAMAKEIEAAAPSTPPPTTIGGPEAVAPIIDAACVVHTETLPPCVPVAVKRKRGRPSLIADDSLEKLKAIARDGKVTATHAAIAGALGVSKPTAKKQLRSLEKSGAVRMKTGPRGASIRLM
ncbi:MAG: hypothetical protein QM780_16435 [Hyphomicrobium sp.]|uniref:winged helix-turn-helix domain-containing protein n=1 Tax=Hyphomicrobium sp. TaxID=82 RepID=UPI0039E5E24A